MNQTSNTDEQRQLDHKPSRVLIQLINAIPLELLNEISPRSINLRRFGKAPLVMLLSVASIQVGVDLIFFKFAQQLIGNGSFKEDWFLIITLTLIAISMALFNIHWVNLSVKFYDQTDVIPIYMASLMITEMLCGLIIGNEFRLYNAAQLFGIFFSSITAVAGI